MSTPFKMKGINFGVSPMKAAGCGPGDDGCGGNFKVDKPGTVVSRAAGKVGSWISRGVEKTVSNVSKSIKKGKEKRNTVDYRGKKGSYKNPKTLATNPNLHTSYAGDPGYNAPDKTRTSAEQAIIDAHTY